MSMAPARETPDTSPSVLSQSSQPSKPQRVLACVLCQRRKVKCDRRFPCSNCTKSGVCDLQAKCEQAALAPRQRRRRFPERNLVKRVRKYEELLRENNIEFEPLPQEPAGGYDSPVGGYDLEDLHSTTLGTVRSSPSTTGKPERVYEANNHWHTLNQGFRHSDNDSNSSGDEVLTPGVVKKVFEQSFANDDHLLFGSRRTAADLSTLHPNPIQIIRLWQIYLDNVNPLLKVTHTPSLQTRIIEAASDVRDISPTLQALMFSIYCMSVLSLDTVECRNMFGQSKEDALTAYQSSCQQALANCGFLRSSDRECLIALYLYLVSLSSSTDPRSLSSMLGVAIRIAQRMGIQSEATNATCTILEAEMRRRLWWSLVLFDFRIGELANYKNASLAPTWDCKIPLNVNDSDLRPEMKKPPAVEGKSTEALFVAVRAELGDSIRHTRFHLDFGSPALKPVPTDGGQSGAISEDSELIALKNMIEDKYLKFCDPENPLHFMTIWISRGHLARYSLKEYYARYSRSSVDSMEAIRDTTLSHALDMLQCDTKIMASSLVKGYLWLTSFNFPFLAYIQITQDLRQRPVNLQAERAWKTMSDNFEARFGDSPCTNTPFFGLFSKTVLAAWEVRESMFRQSDESFSSPAIVSRIRERLAQKDFTTETFATEQPVRGMSMGNGDFPMIIPTDFGLGGQGAYGDMTSAAYPNMQDQAPSELSVNQSDWTAMDWNLGSVPAW